MTKVAIAFYKDWMSTGAYFLMPEGFSPDSARQPILVAYLDREDQFGIWIANITPAKLVTVDGSPVTFKRLLVPWLVIHSVGVIEDDAEDKVPIGFR
jgi:hypothetical protein